EHVMRAQARSVVTTLARLAPRGAQVVGADGSTTYTPLDRIVPGMELLLRPGDRVPVDSVLRSERAELDLALVTGEPLPVSLETGASLPAGATNLGFAARVEAVRPASDSFLARAAALMEAAEGTRTRYRRIADRAAGWYGPVVYLAAAATFIGWAMFGGWHAALVNAVAVLIVTCPCALALAVPMVHVIAAERLLRQGIVMRDGAALERLTTVRVAAFDKTGTLTEGRPSLAGTTASPDLLATAARLAAASNHPLSRAIVAAHGAVAAPAAVEEHPGAGVEAVVDGTAWRLGSPAFCGASDTAVDRTTVWLARDGRPVARFTFDDRLRPEAVAT